MGRKIIISVISVFVILLLFAIFFIPNNLVSSASGYYNFSSAYQGVVAWALMDSDNYCSACSPPNNLPPYVNLPQSITSNAGLDKLDAIYVTTSADLSPFFLFNFTINNSNISDVLNITFGWYGKSSGITVEMRGYIWNYSSSEWVQCINSFYSTTVTRKTCEVLNQGRDFISTSNTTSFLIWGNRSSVVTLSTDFVYLDYTYDSLVINKPTSNQEILNNLSTILNTSQTGYNQTIWYTWNNGIKNYTLCTDAPECASVITFPRQGVYNLTVYANKSDGTTTSQTVSNLFTGNVSSNLNFSSTYEGINLFAYDTGGLGCSASNALTGSHNSCIGTTITTSSSLDKPDGSYEEDDGVYIRPVFLFVINLSTNRVGSINWLSRLEDRHRNDFYLYNHSMNSWDKKATYYGGTGDWYNKTISTSFAPHFINDSYYSHFLIMGNEDGADIRLDYIYVNYSYYSQNSPPTILQTIPNNSNYSTSTINFTFNITDDNDYLTNISIYLNGTLNMTSYLNQWINISINNSFNFSISNIPDGTYNWSIQSYDSDGAQSNSSTYLISVDSTFPQIVWNDTAPYLRPEGYNSSEAKIYFRINLTEANCKYTEFHNRRQGSSELTPMQYSDCRTSYNKTTNLVDGVWDYWVVVEDLAGNINKTSNRTIRIDTISPSILVYQPTQGEAFTSTTIDFKFYATDSLSNVSSCWFRNNTDLLNITVACDANFTFTSPAGSHKVYFWVNDSAGNIATVNRTFSVILDALGISLISPLYEIFLNNATLVNFTFNATDPNGNGLANCSLYGNWTGDWHFNQTNQSTILDSNHYSFFANLTDGNYKWNILCFEATGINSSWGIVNYTFGVDTIFPQINLTHPRNISYTNDTLSINFTATDLNRDSCVYNINGTENNSISSCENMTFTANQGASFLNIFINDSANNINTTLVSFFVDSINPNITLSTTFASGDYLNYNTSITFNLTISDTNRQSCWYSLNGGANTSLTCGNNLTLDAIDESFHTLSIYANDTLNNQNNTNISFYTDSKSPNVSIGTITKSDNQITFPHTESDTYLDTCKYSIFDLSGSPDCPTVCTLNLSVTCNTPKTTTVSAYGTYTLYVYVRDKAGNEAVDSQSFTTSSSSDSTSGGGGGFSPLTIAQNLEYPVVMLVAPSNKTKDYKELARSIIYAQFNNYCERKVTGTLSVINYYQLCSLESSEIANVSLQLSLYEINISIEDLLIFYQAYKQNQISQFYTSRENIEKYNLVEAIVQNLLILNPARIDTYFIAKPTIFYDILSNKELQSCEVISSDTKLGCEIVKNTTARVSYNLTNIDFFDNIYSGKVSITTAGETTKDRETRYVDVVMRVYNFSYSSWWTFFLPAWVSIIIYPLLLIGFIYVLIKFIKVVALKKR